MHEKGKLFIRSLIIGGLLLIWIPSVSAMDASDGPDVVELEALVKIYGPVTFDHTMHVEVASCATCHHHTTGEPAEDDNCLRCHQESGEADEVTCGGCHPENRGRAENVRVLMDADLYHNDTAGLKRAYHLKCVVCHQENDVPSGCEDCHPKRDDGDDMASAGN